MKTSALTWFIVLTVASCGSVQQINKIDDHFYSDLASENNRIAGTLYFDVFSKNLDTLSYEYYVSYLEKNEAPSAKGLGQIVRKANNHYFETRKAAFLVLLYYKDARRIVGDNSGTAFIDTVIQLNPSDSIPSLRKIASRMRF
jgi:hypothetical protein